MVAPRARVGLRFYDVVFTRDTAYVVPIPGAIHEWVGFALGWLTLSGILGYWVASRWVRTQNAGRVAMLRVTPVAELERRTKRFGVVRYDAVVGGAAVSGALGTVMRLKVSRERFGRRRVAMVWAKHHLDGVDLGAALAATMGPKVVVRRQHLVRRVLTAFGVAFVSISLLLAFTKGLLRFGGDDRRSSLSQGAVSAPFAQRPTTSGVVQPGGPAAEAARAGCGAVIRLGLGLGGREPTAAELDNVFGEFATNMEAAGRVDPAYLPLATEGRELQSLFTRPDQVRMSDAQIDQYVDERMSHIDDACARLGF